MHGSGDADYTVVQINIILTELHSFQCTVLLTMHRSTDCIAVQQINNSVKIIAYGITPTEMLSIEEIEGSSYHPLLLHLCGTLDSLSFSDTCQIRCKGKSMPPSIKLVTNMYTAYIYVDKYMDTYRDKYVLVSLPTPLSG